MDETEIIEDLSLEISTDDEVFGIIVDEHLNRGVRKVKGNVSSRRIKIRKKKP